VIWYKDAWRTFYGKHSTVGLLLIH